MLLLSSQPPLPKGRLERRPSQIPPTDWSQAFVHAPESTDSAAKLLDECEKREGPLGVAVLDSETGFCLGRRGQALDPDMAWAHLHCLKVVVRHEGAAESITTTSRYLHLARAFSSRPELVIYVVVDPDEVRLANARRGLHALAERIPA
jgi:hypothetical protein